jgi:hypothetical protein
LSDEGPRPRALDKVAQILLQAPEKLTAKSHTGWRVRSRARLCRILGMSNITTALSQLEEERTRLVSQIDAVQNAISALNGSGSNGSVGRRTLSPAARARIAAAQRARWAKVKNKKIVSISAGKKKRKMSAAAIARIRAAQKARWAKWRKSNKKSA